MTKVTPGVPAALLATGLFGRVRSDIPNEGGTPKTRTMPMGQVMLQSEAAMKAMKATHEQLIAEGWVWDGQDGYSAPPGLEPMTLTRAKS